MTVAAFGTYTQTAVLTAYYAADPAQSTATVPATGTVGVATSITVQAVDTLGANMTVGGDTVVISITGANTATPTVTDNADGTYTASYTPTAGGADSVAITLNGTAISGSPYTSTVAALPNEGIGLITGTGALAGLGYAQAIARRSPIDRLWNHRLVLYRNEPATGVFNEPIPVWTKPDVPGGMNCTPNQNWAGALQDHGPGIQQNAMRVWYLHKDVAPEETDILHIIYGPEAPLYLRVESATLLASLRRRGQPTSHIEVNVEVWPGDPSELEPGGGEDAS